ncbi:MAG: hypothetical protein LBP19_08150 [Treponema sp.]|jgi:uncharacterized coiled-coil DUF342 family protein|nr:hypothetical protein [Treponema sp.]
MSEQIIVIYALWFLLLYILPVIYFSKKTRTTQELLDLSGLKLAPVIDKNQNVIKMNSNFNDFVNKQSNIMKNNFIIEILGRMCTDAKVGKKVNQNAYISNYKEKCDKFVAYVFFLMHIPFIASLYVMYAGVIAASTKTSLLSFLFMIHTFCFICILLLKRHADSKVALFTDALYTRWYDKIANFDLITIKELRPAVLNALKSEDTNRLLSAVNIFSATNTKRCDMLLQSTTDMTAKLDEFIKLQSGTEVITWQNITGFFNDALKKINELNSTLSVICEHINAIMPKCTELADKTKVDINAMNKNAALLLELKQLLSAYKSDAFSVELHHLERITDSLEHTISGTFTSIDTIIKKNADDLRSSYDKFFAICETFNEAVSIDFERDTIEALHTLNDSFSQELKKLGKTNAELEAVITETSNSTNRLCDSVYDFTQFTLAPNFMNKIRSYVNFTQKLNDAHAKLSSYEQLATLYEQSSAVSVQAMAEQLQKLQSDAERVEQAPVQIFDLQQRINEVKSSIESIDYRIHTIDGRLNTIETAPAHEKKRASSGDSGGTDAIVAEFNAWAAAKAGTKLPLDTFYYLVGDFKIKTKQNLLESFAETKWISNRKGGKKYIFPNPHYYNNVTHIRELYTKNIIKSDGENRIEIIKPCEISDNGYINNLGELNVMLHKDGL